MLEGKEIEVKLGNVGELSVDVDMTGKVIVLVNAERAFDGGVVSSVNKIELELLDLLQKALGHSSVVEKIKALLGV